MERFTLKKYPRLVSGLRYSYVTSVPFLEYAGYVLPRNGEDILVLQDLLFPHEWPSICLPRKKENWQHATIGFATAEDIQKIQAAGIPILKTNQFGEEFYYDPKHFQNPTGKLKQKIHRFTRDYKYTIKHAYPTAKILAFYKFWVNQKPRNELFYGDGDGFLNFGLKNLKKYNIRQVYVEVEGKLVGFAWGISFDAKRWIGIQSKANYDYPGLSRFLLQARANMFPNTTECTLGTGALEPGIIAFKHEIGPVRTVPYSYVLTGAKDERK